MEPSLYSHQWAPKHLAVLKGDCINEVFFFTRKSMAVMPGGQKVAVIKGVRITEVAIRRGFTVMSLVIKKLMGQCS